MGREHRRNRAVGRPARRSREWHLPSRSPARIAKPVVRKTPPPPAAPCQRHRLPLNPGVTHGKPDRPYLESWLRRTRKQLSGSGRLTEVALILSREEGQTPAHWSTYLRDVLDEVETPSLDLLTRIDALLARPVVKDKPAEQPGLF